MISNIEKPYLPAAGSNWALPLYDPLTRILGINPARRSLLAAANLGDASQILDIGCGTGTLALAIKRLYPQIEVIGIDPDPKVLRQANQKAARASADIQFDQGFSEQLPYPDGSFDRVISSFMFHHVADDAKPRMLREAYRVLRNGGSFHLLDVARAGEEEKGGMGKLLGMSRHLKQNSDPKIVNLIQSAGFSDAGRVVSKKILFGAVRTACFYGSKRRIS